MIIGVSGKPRSGKTTVCDFLVSKYKFQHLEISDLVIADVRNWVKDKGVDLNKFNKEDYRLILQGWGHFARVSLGERYWINQILNKVKPPTVIGGIRYPIEIESIHKLGGKVIRINRSMAGNSDSANTETQLENYKDFDVVIDNDGSYEDLYDRVKKLIDKWQEPISKKYTKN